MPTDLVVEMQYLASWKLAMKDIAFGSVAGMISKVFEHPFDLCKVRLQAQVLDEVQKFKGPADCLYQTWTQEGVRGLYRGLSAPVVGAMCENACLFLAYNKLQDAIRWSNGIDKAQLSLPQLALAAGGAGAVASFILTPIELVKCKMQVQMMALDRHTTVSPRLTTQKPKLPSPFQIISSTIRQHGLRGLWLGHTGTLFRETGGSAAWFTMNEYVSSLFIKKHAQASGLPVDHLSKKDMKTWELALAGACAGVSYNVVLFPADSVKSSMQTGAEMRPNRGSTPVVEFSFWHTAKTMYKARGVRGLYAGMGITVLRSMPSSAIIFVVYDGLNVRFR